MSELPPVELEVNERGAGRTIVFTHGWLDAAPIWDGVRAALGDDVHSVAWSLRGHGDSGRPPAGSYSRAHALADLERVVGMNELPVVLAGHSLGGYLSLAYALERPTDVAALVLVAAGPGFRRQEAREQWNESVDASAVKFDVPAGSEVISKHFDSWVIDSLDQIAVPVLVIVGERDRRFAASAAVFEKHMDVRRSVVVGDAGHMVHRDQSESVAEAIRAFMAEL